MVCKDMQGCGPWGATLWMEEYVLNRWQKWHGLNYAPNMFLRVLVVLVVLIVSILPIVVFVSIVPSTWSARVAKCVKSAGCTRCVKCGT